jgi:hypothetical protein
VNIIYNLDIKSPSPYARGVGFSYSIALYAIESNNYYVPVLLIFCSVRIVSNVISWLFYANYFATLCIARIIKSAILYLLGS